MLAGCQAEALLCAKFESLKPSPVNTLQPVFVHCQGSFSFIDHATGSKKNPIQVDISLDLIKDLVAGGIAPTDVVIISPYKANVDHINRRLRRPEYASLQGISEASTVDAFQGHEGTIIVLVMGTTKAVGPGFTLDEKRLNVMMSRQKSFLLIVGDMNVVGKLADMVKAKGKDKWKSKSKGVVDKFQVIGVDGLKHWNNSGELGKLLKILFTQGRIAEVADASA